MQAVVFPSGFPAKASPCGVWAGDLREGDGENRRPSLDPGGAGARSEARSLWTEAREKHCALFSMARAVAPCVEKA